MRGYIPIQPKVDSLPSHNPRNFLKFRIHAGSEWLRLLAVSPPISSSELTLLPPKEIEQREAVQGCLSFCVRIFVFDIFNVCFWWYGCFHELEW